MQAQNMRAELSAGPSRTEARAARPNSPSRSGPASPSQEPSGVDGEDHQVAWARQEQEVRTRSLVAYDVC